MLLRVLGTKLTWMIGTPLAVALLVGVHVFVVSRDSDWESPGGDTATQIESFVEHELDESGIPGASVAVVEDGQVTLVSGFGTDGRDDAITPDTPFWIGSNTKSFTALAIMQLVERGDVEIDAPVQRYVPEFTVADEDAAGRITVRHLLNQTSGFSRADGIEPLLAERVESLEQAVARMAEVELNRAPGSTFEYSNLNFVLLGLVVERVSGRTWGEYVDGEIFGPLGMTNSFTAKEAAEAVGLTAVHRFWFGEPVAQEVKYLPGLAPTGWIYSSASDMARYLAMYLGDGELDGVRVLSAEGIATMLEPATNEVTRQLQSQSFTYAYGEGWFVGEFGAAEDARWHLGNHPSFTAWMVLSPGSKQGVIVLLNAGSQLEVAGANSVMSRIPLGVVNLMRGEEPPTGMGLQSFYRLFVLDAAVLVLALGGLLVVTVRNRAVGASRFAVGVAVGGLVVVMALAVVFALSLWRPLFGSMPDVAVVIGTVLVMLVVIAGVRVVRVGMGARGVG